MRIEYLSEVIWLTCSNVYIYKSLGLNISFIIFEQNTTYSKCVCVFTQKLHTTNGGMLGVDFPGKCVLPPLHEYVLGERDAASVRPQNANPINIFVILNYKVRSSRLAANKMIYPAIIICLRDVKPVQT
jgi:hypothetical protein